MAEIIFIASALGVHLWYLLHTTFVDWPEMILYPWFLTKGLVYYRDVVLAYVPGAYYLLHALYSVLGYHVQSERVIAYGFILLTDILVYIVARNLTKRWWVALMSLVFFVYWQPILSGNTIWYETILAPLYIVTFFCTIRYLKKPGNTTALGIGVLLAAATLIKQTAIWFVIGMMFFFPLVHALLISSVVVAAHVFVWSYFAIQGAGEAYGFWVYGFLLSLSKSGSYYILPPTRTDIMLLLPSVLPLLALLVSRPTKPVLLLITSAIALFFAALPRWGLHRLQPVLAVASIGFGLFLGTMLAAKKRYQLVAGLTILLMTAFGSWRSLRIFLTLRDSMQPRFFDTHYKNLVSYTMHLTSEPIYVLGNYDYLYFGRNERPTVLPWVPLFPWNAKVSGVQQQIIESLERKNVPYILYIPYHFDQGYYLDYSPEELLLYVQKKYEKIAPIPIQGGWLYRRK